MGDLVRTVIVDSTVTCRMRRADVIDNANIRAGDVIVGLESYGKATYENEYQVRFPMCLWMLSWAGVTLSTGNTWTGNIRRAIHV